MDIVITGSVAYDYLMTFPGHFREHILTDRLERLSLSFLVDSLIRQRGGIAPNIAYTMALLGERPRVMATVGTDFDEYRVWLESKGVDTSLIKAIAGDFTASFFATTDRANSQIASFYPGAMKFASELRFSELPQRPDLVVISPNEPGAMRAHVRECKELDIPYFYDPGQQIVRVEGDELREGITGCALLVVNDYEFAILEKKTGWGLKGVLQRVKTLIITRGADGASVYSDEGTVNVLSVPSDHIVDPTGVGDAFRGGVLTGMARGWNWKLCAQVGALAATYCLEQKGAQSHNFTRTEFVTRFRRHFDDGGILESLSGRKENR